MQGPPGELLLLGLRPSTLTSPPLRPTAPHPPWTARTAATTASPTGTYRGEREEG